MANNQYQEAREIAKRMSPFSKGSFIVGGVAYNPNAVRDKTELEVIAVVDNLRGADFKDIQKALGIAFNPAAVQSVSQGKANVFDVHYVAPEGFQTGIYFRDGQAHQDVCDLGPFRRFTDRPGVPRSCSMRSLDGEQMVFNNSIDVSGGKVYAHYSVADTGDKLWFGFPATNILMTPTIIEGDDFLRDSFKTFQRNLKAKLSQRYKQPSVNLVGCINENLAKMMVSGLRVTLENYRLTD